MPSNDARTLLQAAVPATVAGAVAVAISAVVAGGKGALGAFIGTLVAVLFMGIGLVALQRTAKSYPQLFQAMGLLLYTVQLLLIFVLMAALQDTTFFNPKAFGISLVATTVVWIAAQARGYMKAKILYVEPGSSAAPRGEKSESSS
ncbi:hypothetical protein [Streptomyces sp. A5-4]|uniref:hypothetical protein n=1 Tax=Streptomyces sp. A5-4 TaxID=3384771 RepID=UPI003DA94A6E